MKLLVNGDWIDGNRLIEVRNPYNDEIIDTVPKASVEIVRKAIDIASRYDFRLTAWERYKILATFSERLLQEKTDFARLIALENGKTLKDAEGEVLRSYQTFLLSAEEAKRLNGEVLPIDAVEGPGAGWGLVIREPIGVVVAIGPFNYPLNLIAHKIGPALAANNPVVIKPASTTPLTALKMAELLLESGLPPEMISVVPGDASEIGDELVTNPLVAKISFTGSTPVGKAICQKAGMTKVCMELGGNDPVIVLDDADLDKAVPAIVTGAFGNNGERCTSVKRIIAQENIADDLVERMVIETRKLKVGDQMDPETDVGPLITRQAAEEIQERVELSRASGSTLLEGGRHEGALYWPTVMDNVKPDHLLVKEETFGPVAPVMRVNTFENAIAMANDTPYGLQSGIFTNDLDKAKRAALMIQAGAVMINKASGFRAEHLPFSGRKDSGIGMEGVKYAVESMSHLKTIVW